MLSAKHFSQILKRIWQKLITLLDGRGLRLCLKLRSWESLLLVPLAIAMDDHQTANASSLARHNAADILPESEFTPERVKTTLEARLNDSNWLKTAATAARGQGRPNAAAELAELVISAVK